MIYRAHPYLPEGIYESDRSVIIGGIKRLRERSIFLDRPYIHAVCYFPKRVQRKSLKQLLDIYRSFIDDCLIQYGKNLIELE